MWGVISISGTYQTSNCGEGFFSSNKSSGLVSMMKTSVTENLSSEKPQKNRDKNSPVQELGDFSYS